MNHATLYLPQLAATYSWLGDATYALARVVAGAAMVPHGLRATFGFFSGTGRAQGLRQTVDMLESRGFRPGRLWALALAFCHFAAGPLLALGFLTRPAAVVCLIMLVFASYDRWRVGGYFANNKGFEFPVVWAAMVLVFIGSGAGPYSIDLLVFGREF